MRRRRKEGAGAAGQRHRFREGQVLYSKLRPYLNKAVIADEDGYCTQEILPLDFGGALSSRYALIFLTSPHFVGYADRLSYGVKMPRLGTRDGRNALVPVPPMAEQERIADRVGEIFRLLDACAPLTRA